MHINSPVFFVAIRVHFDSLDLPAAFSPTSHRSDFIISVDHGSPTFVISVIVEIPTAFSCKNEILVLKMLKTSALKRSQQNKCYLQID